MAKPLLCLWMREPSRSRRLTLALEKERLRVHLARSEDDAMRRAREAAWLIIELEEGRGAAEIVRFLGNANAELGILVVARADGIDRLQVLEAGAMGILGPGASVDDVLKAARALVRGEVRLDPALAARVLRRVHDLARLCADQGIDYSRCARLSPREREVISFMERGFTNEEIAASLGVSAGTVKTHVHQILRKLGVENRRLAGAYWRLFRQTGGE